MVRGRMDDLRTSMRAADAVAPAGTLPRADPMPQAHQDAALPTNATLPHFSRHSVTTALQLTTGLPQLRFPRRIKQLDLHKSTAYGSRGHANSGPMCCLGHTHVQHYAQLQLHACRAGHSARLDRGGSGRSGSCNAGSQATEDCGRSARQSTTSAVGCGPLLPTA